MEQGLVYGMETPFLLQYSALSFAVKIFSV